NMEATAVREALARYDAEKNAKILATAFEVLTKLVTLNRTKVEKLQQMLSEKKLKQNMQALTELKQESSTSLPVLQSELDEIEKLTKQGTELVSLVEKTQSRKKEIKNLLEEVEQDKLDTLEKDRIDVGASQAFALSLLAQLYELPNLADHQRELAVRKKLLSEVTYQLIDLRTRSRNLIDLDAAVEEEFAQLEKKLEATQAGSLSIFESTIREKLRELLIRKRDTIDNLVSSYSDLVDALTQLDASQRVLVETVIDYREFIQKRIFWIRSDQSLGLRDCVSLFDRQSYPITSSDLKQIVIDIASDCGAHPLVYLLAIAILVLLLLMRVQASRELTGLADQVRKTNASDIVPTLRAILLTAVIAAPGPLAVLFFGWRLHLLDDGMRFRAALSQSLLSMGYVYAGFEFLRQVCRRHGLVDAHFNGPNTLSSRTRQDMLIMGAILLPLWLLVSLMNRLTTDVDRLILERVLFAVGMIIVALFAHRILRPSGQLMREVLRMKVATPISRTRWLWYPLATIFPVILSCMAWAGYYYTASQLSFRLLTTAFLLCGILILWGIELRWYRMSQRWFRMFMMRERRRNEAEESQTLEGQRLKLEKETQVSDQDRERQTLRLINFMTLIPLLFGLGYIWSDVLPAVSYLDRIEFWSIHVERAVEGPDGNETMQLVKESITPFNLLIAGVALAVTIGLTRNLPGMIDFAVLQRVGFDASLRYALTTVLGYVLIFIGTTYALSSMGFRWEQIQWLATALTFGLSFGLQEIFANFVSGLIILFERPVRIGDIVTIEGVTGVVTRIRIRASTITDWDRKEYLVPNKELVTGRLLNWTLSDTLNRLTIPVGVAYGTDTDHVRELLFEIARSEPEILTDPEPLVTFENFGESTLDFVMRVYLGKMENRLETIHRLHTRIHKRFKEESIEIAFPQRDLHVRSMPPGWSPGSAGHGAVSHAGNGKHAN
ncbi:MAG: mechanosensitive ion channel, partial [Planctomycetaceae bacterium]|nr:mechanosensitive ion channel [Planctomycetaceae bacterium]